MVRLASSLGLVGGLVGLVGGLAWLVLPFYPPECAPVTGASEVFCNRLWTPALAAMAVGAWAFLRTFEGTAGRGTRIALGLLAGGFTLMALGNGGEYWLFSHLPHQGPNGWVRGLLWMSALVGWLVTLVSSFAIGIGWLRGTRSPSPGRWLGVLFALPLLLTVLLAFTLGPNWAPLSAGLAAIVVGTTGIRLGRRPS